MTEYAFKAPTGAEIRGTNELLSGTCGVTFVSSQAGYEFDGSGTKVDWDGSETETIREAAVFADDNGDEWLQHHLIPIDADPQPDEAYQFLRDELAAGRALALADKLVEATRGMGNGTAHNYALGAQTSLRIVHARTRAASKIIGMGPLLG